MSNKINKQLKKGSPLFDLGQGIASLLDFEAIGRASNPNRSTGTDLMGRGLIHLGAIMSKMDEDFDPGDILEEPDPVYEDPTFDTADDPPFDPNSVPVIDEEDFEEDVEMGLYDDPEPVTTEPKNKRPKLSDPPPKERKTFIQPQREVVRDTTGSGTSSTQQMIRTDIANNPEKIRDAFPDLTGKKINLDVAGVGLTTPTETSTSSGVGTYDYGTQSFTGTGSEEEFGFLDYIKSGVQKVRSLFQRQMDELDDDNPIKRLAIEQPETFEAFKGLMYRRRYKNESPLRKIAHLHQSPFLKTDAIDAQGVPDMSKVDYRYAQRAAIPGYAEQGFGQAAAEGFNLAIDRSNYKKAVQADYDKEVEDTMGELVIDSEYAGDSFDKQKMEFASELKRQAYNDMVQYTKGEITFVEKQSRLEGYKNRAKVISSAGNALAALSKEVSDDKGLHDLAASKPENAAFYNTLRDNPGAFKLETIDGQEYIVGKTMVNGKPADDVKLPLAQIANGKAALKLVPKVNPQSYVQAGIDTAKKYVEEMETRFGVGKGNVSAEQLRPRMEEYFMSVINQDETKLRSLAAQTTEGKFDYDAFEQMINDPDPDRKKLNMQLLQNDIVNDLMLDWEAQYFPNVVTTKFDPAKTGIVPATATKEGTVDKRIRTNTEKFLSDLNNMGEITEENVGNLSALGEIRRARIQDGILQIEHKSGKKYNLSSDPEVRIRQIITIAGGNAKYIK